jgi:hypothetical protein
MLELEVDAFIFIRNVILKEMAVTYCSYITLLYVTEKAHL